MTMADTIAVMSAGRIEQLGGPAELYESPTTTFVANFLGQSNLIRAGVTGTQAAGLLLTAHGSRLAMPASRRSSGDTDLLIGIRPEKIRLAESGSAPGDGENVLPGGIVTDASFTGVSTQYLVRMPWGQELTVFVQNLGGGGHFAVGSTVDVRWDPAHTFALDGRGDVNAGVQHDEGLEPIPVA